MSETSKVVKVVTDSSVITVVAGVAGMAMDAIFKMSSFNPFTSVKKFFATAGSIAAGVAAKNYLYDEKILPIKT